MVHGTTPPARNYPYYVLATDKFMSGWGHAARKTNRLVFCCTTASMAERVARNLKTRSEMKRIVITSSRPRLSPARYLVQWFTPKGAPNWYAKIPPWWRGGKCQ